MAEDEKGPENPQTDEDATPEVVAEESQTSAETPQAEAETTPAAEAEASPPAADEVVVEGDEVVTGEELEDAVEATARVKPEIPGADLEVDIVREDEVHRGESRWSEDDDEEIAEGEESEDDVLPEPIADAAIDLAAGARYTATGKRKTAVARVILTPGTGAYTINGRTLEVFFPRHTLQRNIRQPLEQVGYETRMDVVATMHGGGVSPRPARCATASRAP
jgi:small subunit ribosomal protein S9